MTDALRNEAGTPRHIFNVLHEEYHFTVDVCANERNHKLDRYWTKELDGLWQSWVHERVWCNPPYADIPPWLACFKDPDFVAYLLPSRTDREWWRHYKPMAEVHYFVGEKPHKRLQFEPPPGIEYPSNPYCECLMLFGIGCAPGKEVWRSGRTGERL